MDLKIENRKRKTNGVAKLLVFFAPPFFNAKGVFFLFFSRIRCATQHGKTALKINVAWDTHYGGGKDFILFLENV